MASPWSKNVKPDITESELYCYICMDLTTEAFYDKDNKLVWWDCANGHRNEVYMEFEDE